MISDKDFINSINVDVDVDEGLKALFLAKLQILCKTTAYKSEILLNTVALNSYLGLSALSKFFFWFV